MSGEKKLSTKFAKHGNGIARDAQAAMRFLDELDEGVDRIQKNPLDSLEYEYGTYVRMLKKFPYQIVFRMKTPVELEVLAVMHERRRPGYWSKRL